MSRGISVGLPVVEISVKCHSQCRCELFIDFASLIMNCSTSLLQIEEEISKKYQNRRVNIMGEINTI